ncbi:hypothetical protein DERP_002815 [Dermatophagoides pteronyssinus]|uniref:Uncharacterized protein n=1 Tax=Dermatophagoides pteronyssinus TaxID=6956 RepID=A0ABQ8JWB8_DERPT|nr:hypothetical protein DERP_002815 [Dermatophagoides pteronyssinus]
MATTTATTTTTPTKLMDKDEQLQLCIQRFVSDTQSMINQFSELFIGELRRFADVCMEFSVSYRTVQEDRQFLSAENKSLKDELDARTAEVDFLGKELREIREENDELIRKIGCLNINSDGEISMMINHDRPRDYAVVNSMPAFPRRYSGAIGYEPPASSAGSYHHHHREEIPIEENAEFNLSIESSLPSMKNSKNQLMLLTPPIAFKSNITNNNNNNNNDNIDSSNIKKTKLSPSPTQSSDNHSSNNNHTTIRSHSRDDISTIYAHLLNNDTSDSGSQQLFGLNSGSSRNSDRSPSFDEIHGIGGSNAKTIQMVYNQTNGLKEQRILSTAVSSSAGTFYDCSSMSNFDNLNDNFVYNSNQQQLIKTVTDQIRQLYGRPTTTETIPDQSSSINTAANNNGQCTVIDVELKKHNPAEMIVPDGHHYQLSTIDPMYSFIAKTPSPNHCDYGQHLDKYLCDNDVNNDKESGDIDEFLLNAPPVQRYNSKKLSKKRKSRRRVEAETKRDDDDDEQHLIQQQDQQQQISIMIPLKSIDSVSIIPSPKIDLNRYLLVEICHIISPSHFYLIINDEKIGTNAFEDFLERFQNFYKSIETIEQDGGLNADDDIDDDERQLRLSVCMPPSNQSLTIGSYWACYIDDELDWRRVQIIDRSNLDEHYNSENDGHHDDYVLVKDVDSGYSSLVHVQMIRSLTNEMAKVPAFAVRSSLAFIYPHHQNHHQQQSSHGTSQYYDQWPMECCQFFEDMTYDQILTASVLQINNQSSLETNTNLDDEIAHVLLWCTSADDYEIFINRKLIELNYASNVAEDDSWMEQFNEVLNNNNTSSTIEEPNIETCFNIQLAKTITNETATTIVANVLPSTFQTIENNDQMFHLNRMDQWKQLQTMKMSKKKKGTLNEIKDVNNECLDSCINQQPVVPIQMIGDEDCNGHEPVMNIITNNNTTMKTIETETNQSLSKTMTVNNEKMIKKSICSSSDSPSQNNIKHQQKLHTLPPPSPTSSLSPSSSPQSPNSLLQLSIEHWILQKHSRHVTLKKTFMPDKISYLLVISCYFEPNKFIGILPFGERKIDNEQLCQFVRNIDESNTPFRQFVNDMTEFYSKESSSSLKLLPEQCIFEQNNTSSTIVFYDQQSGLFLRGHIVGRDMMSESQTNNNEYEQQLHPESMTQSKSAKDLPLKVSNNDNDNDDNRLLKKKKTLSLKRRSLHDYTTLYIIYAIDAGRYYQVPLKHIYHLDDRFKITKPFAIVCKLHGYPNNKSKLSKIRSIIMEKKIFGIRFIDIDFSSERFAVELFTLDLKDEEFNIKINNRSSTSWRFSSPLISKNLIHLL